MDEITHEMWMDGEHRHDFAERSKRVKISRKNWSSPIYTVKALEEMGWEVRPIHIELENK